MRLAASILALAFSSFLSAADNPLAGSWKLNAAKSQGPVPPCVQNGILNIRAGIYTGPSKPNQEASPAPESRKCNTVYLFTPSPDGRTLTLTRHQGNPADHSVFDKLK